MLLGMVDIIGTSTNSAKILAGLIFLTPMQRFRLSQGKSAEEIQQAVKALFLGEYANSLETIMIKCRDKFETKSREFSDRIASRKLEEAKIEADLATVRKIKNTSATLLDELQSHCSKNGLLKPIGKAKPSDLVNLQEMVEEICAHFE